MKTEDWWNDFHEMIADDDEKLERGLLHTFPDALLNENDQIYIRKTGGRLMWLKANVHGGGKEWQEVTPTLAVRRRREAGDITDEESLEMLRDKLKAKIQDPELYEIGWYQDLKGDLYRFDGKTWVGAVPDKNKKDTLEFLG